MLQRFSYLGLETAFEEAEFVVLPVPYSNSSGVECAREFPFEFIKQSLYTPGYDPQYNMDLNKLKVHTMDFYFPSIEPKKTIEELSFLLDYIKSKNKIPIMIGGDHSITIAAKDHYSSFLILDAHLDLFNEYMGSEHSHACVSKRLSENGTVYIWGARERELEEDLENVKVIESAKEIKEKELYLSLDLDVLDPSLVKVQTPSPNGKTFSELIEFLETINREKNIVGIDIVEGCAEPYTAQLATRILSKILIQKIISYF